ncbi:DUF7260 family protein [Halorientalis halophila]|uniref:DUF7260 family protein n=1 Tax=Halorientalis halophila TaxID=3108499 RepID=UPI00300AADDA
MPGTTHPLEPLQTARDRLRLLRRRAVDERDAFDQFCTRVEVVPTTEATDVPDPILSMTTATERGVSALRTSYRDTVLAVPHAVEPDVSLPAFDDLLPPGEAVELRWATRLTPALQTAIRDPATAEHERRVERIGAVDAELAALDRTEGLARDLLAVESGTDGSTADRSRLASLSRRCRRHTARRRATLAARDQDPESTALPADCYADLSVSDPVLSVLNAVADLLPASGADTS